MRQGGPPLLPPPMAQLPVVSSPSPLHHCPWCSCLSCRRRRAAARSTAACHVVAIAPLPVAQLPVVSSPSRYYPSRSCDHTATHHIAITFVACHATVVLQTEPGTWGLHRGGEARKKREKKFTTHFQFWCPASVLQGGKKRWCVTIRREKKKKKRCNVRSLVAVAVVHRDWH